MSFKSKLPEVGTTIFTIMSNLAQKHQAINLSQGFPDFQPHPKLIEITEKTIHKGLHQYAPMAGYLPLREAIAEKTQKLYRASYHPETEITITAGATQAIFTAIMAFVQAEDEVIIIEPVYDSYVPAIALCGAVVRVSTLNTDNFSPNWQEIESLINEKTKAILINTPHNPSGSVWKAEDMQKLEQIVAHKDILVISDEVYEHIVFDKQRHQSVALYPNLRKKSIVVSSFGKTYHCTGWKVGYVLAPEALMQEFRKVHQYNVFCVNNIAQMVFAEILKEEELYLSLGQFYEAKRDFFRYLLQGSRFELKSVSGTYFQVASYQKISEQKDYEFCVWLTEKVGVAAIPLSSFYIRSKQEGLIRFCFAKENSTLEKAAEKLVKV
ncbi:MAG: pyridoxal phosphate-dependent aminotransferase [Raineya sp.]